MATFRTVNEIEIDFDDNLKYFNENISNKVDKYTNEIYLLLMELLKCGFYKEAYRYWMANENIWTERDGKTDHFRFEYMELLIKSVKNGNVVNSYGNRMESIPMNQFMYRLNCGTLETV